MEDEEAEEEGQGATELVESSQSKEVSISNSSSEVLDRTDDPVRMYLREMGTVELLSREGEIAIAKRIEAGRSTMILGLCESPLTFQAITIWTDELLNEDILLRDVIDLEATFGTGLDDEEGAEELINAARVDVAPIDKASKVEEKEFDADGNVISTDDDEDDEEQANMSLCLLYTSPSPRD